MKRGARFKQLILFFHNRHYHAFSSEAEAEAEGGEGATFPCAAVVARASAPKVFTAEKKGVVFCGAGLSGLNAAMIFAEQGCNVTLLEASHARAYVHINRYQRPPR